MRRWIISILAGYPPVGVPLRTGNDLSTRGAAEKPEQASASGEQPACAVSALFAFLHHVAAFTLVAALAVEFVVMREELTVRHARGLLLADATVGVSAVTALAAGFMRVFFFEKGAVYYFHSASFIGKIGLFVLIALLSIYPTLEFLSWRKTLKQGQVPIVPAPKMRAIRTLINLELAGVILLLLFAAAMAKGIG
jgi:putative membrane protein